MTTFDFVPASGVVFEATEDGLTVRSRHGHRQIETLPAVAAALAQLDGHPLGMKDLAVAMVAAGAPLQSLGVLHGLVRRFVDLGLIDRVITRDGVTVARFERKGQLTPRRDEPSTTLWLSRHVVAVPADDGWRLDSGLSAGAVWVHHSVAGEVLGSEFDADTVDGLGSLLWAAGLAVAEREPQFEHRMWDPVDLLATQRGCDSRGGQPYGGTYRFEGEVPPPPARDPAVPIIETLAYPDTDPDAWSADPPYGEVLRRRRSRLDFNGTAAPTLAAVTALLRRTTTVREHLRDDHGLEATRRLVPAGGGVHEVDLYLAVSDVDGLAPGLYRNEPIEETLERVQCRIDPKVLVDVAAGSLPVPAQPALVIVFVARFDRLMWKYEGVALPLVLKHVGVLTQALYLAAAVEGLGVCALGGAASSLFTDVTGLGLPSHGVVGQLVVGSAPGP